MSSYRGLVREFGFGPVRLVGTLVANYMRGLELATGTAAAWAHVLVVSEL